jgi:hypothetical protein
VGQDRLELSANGLRERTADSQERDTKEDREDSAPSRPPSSPIVGAVGQSGGNQRALDCDAAPSPDLVEVALAEALAKASAAAQWEVVARLAGELEARRKARAAVVDIGTARAKRRR